MRALYQRKIYKFGHKACKDGQVIYLVSTDHNGPYAASLSGARYSSYLWGVRQAKKSPHYIDTSNIYKNININFVDAWGLSGRRVQILHSDGEGVFISRNKKHGDGCSSETGILCSYD